MKLVKVKKDHYINADNIVDIKSDGSIITIHLLNNSEITLSEEIISLDELLGKLSYAVTSGGPIFG